MTAAATLSYVAILSLMTFLGVNMKINQNPLKGLDLIDKQMFLILTAVLFTVGTILATVFGVLF